MELKHEYTLAKGLIRAAFNRTSMELKLSSFCCLGCRSLGAFNRTSMELKPLLERYMKTLNNLLIEPVWN